MSKKAKDYLDYVELQSTQALCLADVPTKVNSDRHSEQQYNALLDGNRAQLEELQNLLYAARTQAL